MHSVCCPVGKNHLSAFLFSKPYMLFLTCCVIPKVLCAVYIACWLTLVYVLDSLFSPLGINISVWVPSFIQLIWFHLNRFITVDYLKSRISLGWAPNLSNNPRTGSWSSRSFWSVTIPCEIRSPFAVYAVPVNQKHINHYFYTYWGSGPLERVDSENQPG